MTFRRSAGQKTAYVLCVAITAVLMPSWTHGQSISAYSGTLSHGSSIVLTGSGFGTKATAAPILYDDFDSGTPGTAVFGNSSAGWSNSGGANLPAYSTTGHRGNGMRAYFPNADYRSSIQKSGNYNNGFYLDAWIRYNNPSTVQSPRVVKFAMICYNEEGMYPELHWGTSGCSQNIDIKFAGYTGHTSFSYRPDYPSTMGNSTWPFVSAGGMLSFNSFVHIQVWVKQSDDMVRNGVIRVIKNGAEYASAQDVITNYDNSRRYNSVFLGHYVAKDDGGTGCGANTLPIEIFWDSVYIDNTQARVELGNAPTYDACTHREIQVPTNWSESSIALKFNQGTFQPGQAFLFVMNAAGSKSAGFPVTVGGAAPPDGAPGQPGKPQI